MTLEKRQVLLETPSGFALFTVREDVLKKPEDVWIRFRDASAAECCMYSLGFVKVEDKTCAFDGKSDSSLKLLWLIKRYCDDGKELYVQNIDIQLKIEEKLGVKCCCDYALVGEVMWGIKNVLHELIPEEKYKITKEYCMPLSTGLQNCFNEYCINLPPLSMFSKEFVSTIEEVRSSASVTSYREEKLTMNDTKQIVSGLAHFSTVPHYVDKIIAYVKAMEADILEKIELDLEEKELELEKNIYTAVRVE